MAQQGPRPPRTGRLSPRGDRRRGDDRWGDDSYPDDDEELPPWAGLAVDPRWAQGSTRGKRHAPARPDTGGGAPAGGAPAGEAPAGYAAPAERGTSGSHARPGYSAPAGYDQPGAPAGYDQPPGTTSRPGTPSPPGTTQPARRGRARPGTTACRHAAARTRRTGRVPPACGTPAGPPGRGPRPPEPPVRGPVGRCARGGRAHRRRRVVPAQRRQQAGQYPTPWSRRSCPVSSGPSRTPVPR